MDCCSFLNWWIVVLGYAVEFVLLLIIWNLIFFRILKIECPLYQITLACKSFTNGWFLWESLSCDVYRLLTSIGFPRYWFNTIILTIASGLLLSFDFNLKNFNLIFKYVISMTNYFVETFLQQAKRFIIFSLVNLTKGLCVQ